MRKASQDSFRKGSSNTSVLSAAQSQSLIAPLSDAYYCWSYAVWGKSHSTPSGHYSENVKVLFDETTYMQELTTGEVWRLETMHECVPTKIHKSDGLYNLWGNLWIRYVNDDGDFVNLHENFRIAYDGPDLVLFHLKVTCAPRK